MSTEYLLNADFDLSLRPRWQQPTGENATHRITDLAWHALFLGEMGDSVLIPEPAPSDFLDYLRRLDVPMPSLTVEPNRRAGHDLSPLGWNAATASMNEQYARPVDHPNLETISRVNGRRFSARLEEDLLGGNHTIAEFDNETDLIAFFAEVADSPTGWVIKAEHGNAGIGNRRLRSRTLGAGDLSAIRRMFEEDDAVLVEKWRPRLSDLCATFVVTSSGEAANFRLHETVNTADGALIGSLFEKDPDPLSVWRPAISDAATAVAERLAKEGFFGRACVDAFVWNDDGIARLRPLVEINARREISAGASALWRRWGGRGAAYWRFFNRRKLRMPDSYSQFEKVLGPDAYDLGSRTGVLLTAPLWLGDDRRTPAKIATLLLGRDRAEVLALDQRLRERLET